MIRKKVLLICPYENIYPPMNGGMQRCFHIIHQLSKYFELTVIMNQQKDKFLSCISLYPSINNVNIYSTTDVLKVKDFFDYFPVKYQSAFRYRWIKKQIRGSADGNFLKYYFLLQKLLKTNKFDTVFLENLSTINAVTFIRSIDKNVNIVYDAHNVDSNLALKDYENGKIAKGIYLSLKKQESNLFKYLTSLLVCSEIDKNTFDILNKKRLNIKVVPNGVELHAELKDDITQELEPKHLLFCGSLNYEPNVEGLVWFYKNCWPIILNTFKHLKLFVVGSGNIPMEFNLLKNDTSIIFSGTVISVQPYYNKATLVIAPLLSGSGTRLKILEAMSFGLPVVSTSKGAEGIACTDKINIIISDSATLFASSIIELLVDIERQKYLIKNAKAIIAELYDWNKVGIKLLDI